MIITENKTGIRFSSIGTQKKVYFNSNGEPFFKWNNRRWYFNDIMTIYPIFCHKENEGDIDYILGGYITLSNTYGVLICIDDGGETITLWNEIESRE